MNPIFVPYLLYVKVSGVSLRPVGAYAPVGGQKIKERENRIEERGIRCQVSGVRNDEHREYIWMNLHLLEICQTNRG